MFGGTRPRSMIFAGVALALLTSAATFLFVMREQARLHNDERAVQMQVEARMLAAALRDAWPQVDDAAVRRLREALQVEGISSVVIDADGTVLLQSTPRAAAAELRAIPEIRNALDGVPGGALRTWGADQQLYVTVAEVVLRDTRVLGAVWLAQPAWSFWANPGAAGRLLAFFAACSVAAVLLLLFLLVRVRRRVLLRLVETARSLATEDDLELEGEDELAVLSRAMTSLRERLATQVETIDRQRLTLQSLIDNLGEGIIAARPDGRIALINPTALRLLDPGGDATRAARLIGRPVEACIRQHLLQQLLLGLPSEDAGATAGDGLELSLLVESGKHQTRLLVRVNELDLPASGDETSEPGRVVVLTDVTTLERAVEMRSDFVANASHELRTPLATIRIAVETLLSMDLAAEPEAARQFLSKIDRHSVRLQQMVADLLDLSRLESPTERFAAEEIDIRRCLQDLQFHFAESLERRKLELCTQITPPELTVARVNPHLLRLVLDNLVDNAIKFSEDGGRIEVGVRVDANEVVFEVADHGCGIDPQEQQRVFERFYQVERARSGAERGTGLGLSIVRHAVGAMQGRVELESAPGQGTRVRVRVPR